MDDVAKMGFTKQSLQCSRFFAQIYWSKAYHLVVAQGRKTSMSSGDFVSRRGFRSRKEIESKTGSGRSQRMFEIEISSLWVGRNIEILIHWQTYSV